MAFSDEELDEMRECLQGQIRAGFADPEKVTEGFIDYYSDEYPAEDLAELAGQMVPELWQQVLAEQASWPEVTDCDRLDRAFRELDKAGIVARHNFSCCGTCGAHEIWDEMEARGLERVRGYAFYHVQDTEAAVAGHGVCLSYGSVEERESAAVAIGHLIVDALQRNGLKTQWEGTHARRIGVSLDWKRRLEQADG